MKIALLNLLYDNNYGGNLQRYALMNVLQEMGHEVTHLNCRRVSKDPYIIVKAYLRRVFTTILRFFPDMTVSKALINQYGNPFAESDAFYKKYINHTRIISNKMALKHYLDYDVYVVGSDQVWRKEYMKWGMETYFFDYLPDNKTKIAYSVSLGSENEEYTTEDIEQLTPLYKKFKAVSVREKSALDILRNRSWDTPKPVLTLDPTLLLPREKYLNIIDGNKTRAPKGDMFIYVLDKTEEVEDVIKKYNLDADYKPNSLALGTRNLESVPQWLRNFRDAKCVITDSYHGFVFSIIFNKPFFLVVNEQRGSARFVSLLNLLGLKPNSLGLQQEDWIKVNKIIENLRTQSIGFIEKSLA